MSHFTWARFGTGSYTICFWIAWKLMWACVIINVHPSMRPLRFEAIAVCGFSAYSRRICNYNSITIRQVFQTFHDTDLHWLSFIYSHNLISFCDSNLISVSQGHCTSETGSYIFRLGVVVKCMGKILNKCFQWLGNWLICRLCRNVNVVVSSEVISLSEIFLLFYDLFSLSYQFQGLRDWSASSSKVTLTVPVALDSWNLKYM